MGCSLMHPSALSQEPSCITDRLVPHSDAGASGRLGRVFYRRRQLPKFAASLGWRDGGGCWSGAWWGEFNRFARLHCERIPVGFGGFGVRPVDGGGVGVEDGLPAGGVESESTKKVLILMSDTGVGHRASAEAIKAAFNQEFGDDYQVFVTDLWSEHTPWPFNQLRRSYNFLVKHGTVWKMTYYGTAPRPVHRPHFSATSTFIARFHKLVTRCYCLTNEVAKRSGKAGLKTSLIKVYGLPVRPSFVKPIRPKDELRKELGLDLHLPAVLLMGGEEGMGPIESRARALGNILYMMKQLGNQRARFSEYADETKNWLIS